MNMSFWQKTKHFDNNAMVDLYNNDKPGFYSTIYNTNTIMPGISLFFKWDNCTRYNMANKSFWWLSPRYGIGFGEYMVAPFTGNSYFCQALYPNYNGANLEFNLDYAKYNNTSLFGFRPYGEETYTGVDANTYTIVVYNKCKTADNRDAYIMLCYAPNRYTNGSTTFNNQSLLEVVGGIYTNTSSTKYAYGVQATGSSIRPADRWMDVNFSKSEDYILHPLVVNGCVSDNIYIIDGGMDVLPNLETITLANKNYFILNRHIAIKIN